MRFFQNFADSNLEILYQKEILEKNKHPCQKLLILNIIFNFFFTIVAINKKEISMGIFSLLNIFLIIFLFILYIGMKNFKRKILSVYILCSILFPFAILFFSLKLNAENQVSNSMDLLILGFCLKSFIEKASHFEISWIEISISKISSILYLLFFVLQEENMKFHLLHILLIIFEFPTFYFAYQKEKKNRENFFHEYLFQHHFENLRQILENMPDQILVYQKKKLVFVNNSTREFFGTKILEEINKKINEVIKINNPHFEKSNKSLLNVFEIENQSFCNLIQNFCDVKMESNSFEGKTISDELFDIRIKKIFWENEISILVLISKVSEKNIKERLDAVNSFLTFALGNISHEINTPLHIIQGNLEALKLKNGKENEIKVIENFLQILNTMTEIMIDLFFIRKGRLLFKYN